MLRAFPFPFGPRLGLLAAWLLVAGPVSQAASAPPVAGPRSGKWAHEGSKLAPDPQVTWGRLDNGVRYALLPHHGVPGRVALQLVVLSGSLDEHDDELGIAHYIEHLAFGGSKHFKAEMMLKQLLKTLKEYGVSLVGYLASLKLSQKVKTVSQVASQKASLWRKRKSTQPTSPTNPK